MSFASFSLWSFVAGLIAAYFVVPFVLSMVGGRKSKVAA